MHKTSTLQSDVYPVNICCTRELMSVQQAFVRAAIRAPRLPSNTSKARPGAGAKRCTWKPLQVKTESHTMGNHNTAWYMSLTPSRSKPVPSPCHWVETSWHPAALAFYPDNVCKLATPTRLLEGRPAPSLHPTERIHTYVCTYIHAYTYIGTYMHRHMQVLYI